MSIAEVLWKMATDGEGDELLVALVGEAVGCESLSNSLGSRAAMTVHSTLLL